MFFPLGLRVADSMSMHSCLGFALNFRNTFLLKKSALDSVSV